MLSFTDTSKISEPRSSRGEESSGPSLSRTHLVRVVDEVLSFLRVQELLALLVFLEHLDRSRVKGRLATLRRSEGDRVSSIAQDVVRMRSFGTGRSRNLAVSTFAPLACLG